jgi:SIS domain
VAGSTQPMDRIMPIWNEHMEVSKALPILAPAVSNAVDIICSSLAAGGQLLIAGNGGSAADVRHIAAELTAASYSNGNPSGPSRCTSTHQLSRRLETITGMNMSLPASYPPMPGPAMCSWRSPRAAIAGISCAQSMRLVRAKLSSSGSRVNLFRGDAGGA